MIALQLENCRTYRDKNGCLVTITSSSPAAGSNPLVFHGSNKKNYSFDGSEYRYAGDNRSALPDQLSPLAEDEESFTNAVADSLFPLNPVEKISLKVGNRYRLENGDIVSITQCEILDTKINNSKLILYRGWLDSSGRLAWYTANGRGVSFYSDGNDLFTPGDIVAWLSE